MNIFFCGDENAVPMIGVERTDRITVYADFTVGIFFIGTVYGFGNLSVVGRDFLRQTFS